MELLKPLNIFSGITIKEKELAIVWLGKKCISVNEVKDFFPELFDYMQVQPMLTPNCMWLSSYIDEYKKAKLGNIYTDEIKTAISSIMQIVWLSILGINR